MSIRSKISRFIDRSLGLPTCEEVEALAYDFLEGRLDPKIEKALLRHLKLCPPCVRFMEAYRKTRAAGPEASPPPLDPVFKDHLLELFKKDSK
ncbi:MAG TPA: zf-HC2 domain-containing protein [bacterium]|nr:zf-HC2 domain-containing protein [bacterium]